MEKTFYNSYEELLQSLYDINEIFIAEFEEAIENLGKDAYEFNDSYRGPRSITEAMEMPGLCNCRDNFDKRLIKRLEYSNIKIPDLRARLDMAWSRQPEVNYISRLIEKYNRIIAARMSGISTFYANTKWDHYFNEVKGILKLACDSAVDKDGEH